MRAWTRRWLFVRWRRGCLETEKLLIPHISGFHIVVVFDVKTRHHNSPACVIWFFTVWDTQSAGSVWVTCVCHGFSSQWGDISAGLREQRLILYFWSGTSWRVWTRKHAGRLNIRVVLIATLRAVFIRCVLFSFTSGSVDLKCPPTHLGGSLRVPGHQRINRVILHPSAGQSQWSTISALLIVHRTIPVVFFFSWMSGRNTSCAVWIITGWDINHEFNWWFTCSFECRTCTSGLRYLQNTLRNMTQINNRYWSVTISFRNNSDFKVVFLCYTSQEAFSTAFWHVLRKVITWLKDNCHFFLSQECESVYQLFFWSFQSSKLRFYEEKHKTN